MFGGAGPPQLTPAEIKAQEAEAKGAVRFTLGACLVLYLSPFVVDYVKKLI